MKDAIEVLRSIETAFKAHKAGEPPFDLLAELERQLAQFEPFQFVHNGWVRTQDGGRTGKQLSSHWAWRQFKKGMSPEEVLKLAAAHVAENSYEVLEVYPIYGMKVTKRFELSPDIYICASDELPKSSQHQMAFSVTTYSLFPPLQHDGSALVFKTKIDPAITPSKPDATQEAPPLERGKLRFLVQHALPLLTHSPIEMPCQYVEPASDYLLCAPGGHFIGGGQPSANKVSLVRDLRDLPALVSSIEAMATLDPRTSSSILLSIDRLTTSRLKVRLEDRILDLGIAAEIALMHERQGDGDGKGEITAKISSRGAWLLGADGAERVAISKQLKALYAARSKVVHSGRADRKLEQKLPSLDQLVVRIIRELLRRRQFPDWNSLTLGAL